MSGSLTMEDEPVRPSRKQQQRKERKPRKPMMLASSSSEAPSVQAATAPPTKENPPLSAVIADADTKLPSAKDNKDHQAVAAAQFDDAKSKPPAPGADAKALALGKREQWKKKVPRTPADVHKQAKRAPGIGQKNAADQLAQHLNGQPIRTSWHQHDTESREKYKLLQAAGISTPMANRHSVMVANDYIRRLAIERGSKKALAAATVQIADIIEKSSKENKEQAESYENALKNSNFKHTTAPAFLMEMLSTEAFWEHMSRAPDVMRKMFPPGPEMIGKWMPDFQMQNRRIIWTEIVLHDKEREKKHYHGAYETYWIPVGEALEEAIGAPCGNVIPRGVAIQLHEQTMIHRTGELRAIVGARRDRTARGTFNGAMLGASYAEDHARFLMALNLARYSDLASAVGDGMRVPKAEIPLKHDEIMTLKDLSTRLVATVEKRKMNKEEGKAGDVVASFAKDDEKILRQQIKTLLSTAKERQKVQEEKAKAIQTTYLNQLKSAGEHVIAKPHEHVLLLEPSVLIQATATALAAVSTITGVAEKKSVTPFEKAVYDLAAIVPPNNKSQVMLYDWTEMGKAYEAVGRDADTIRKTSELYANFDLERAMMEHSANFTKMAAGWSSDRKEKEWKKIVIKVDPKAQQFFENPAHVDNPEAKLYESAYREAVMALKKKAKKDAGMPIDAPAAAGSAAAAKIQIDVKEDAPVPPADPKKVDPLSHYAVIIAPSNLVTEWQMMAAAGTKYDPLTEQTYDNIHAFFKGRLTSDGGSGHLLTLNRELLYEKVYAFDPWVKQFDNLVPLNTLQVGIMSDVPTYLAESSAASRGKIRLTIGVEFHHCSAHDELAKKRAAEAQAARNARLAVILPAAAVAGK